MAQNSLHGVVDRERDVDSGQHPGHPSQPADNRGEDCDQSDNGSPTQQPTAIPVDTDHDCKGKDAEHKEPDEDDH